MSKQEHLVIVDDDSEIRSLLVDYLQKQGFAASAVTDGRELDRVMARRHIDLVILDLMLPGEDGLQICRRLRVETNIPIIMLTARGDDMDRIIGLEIGADDYLPKPFNPRELLARIKSILRRAKTLPNRKPHAHQGKVKFSEWVLDTFTRSLISPDQVTIPLSGAEYQLLDVFINYPNRVLTRDQLLDLAHGREAELFDRSIDMQVSRLRKRLRDKDAQLIQTVRGQGYLLASEVQSL